MEDDFYTEDISSSSEYVTCSSTTDLLYDAALCEDTNESDSLTENEGGLPEQHFGIAEVEAAKICVTGIEVAKDSENLNLGCPVKLRSSPGNDSKATVQPVRYFTKKTLKYQTPSSSMEPLPEGWVTVLHSCGLPVYFHKKTKVLTWSRPYIATVDMGAIKKHDVPVTSIPCLDYVRIREKVTEGQGLEAAFSDQDSSQTQSSSTETVPREQSDELSNPNDVDEQRSEKDLPHRCPEFGDLKIPRAILHSIKHRCLGENELSEYLSKRFEFDTAEIPHFERWADKRLYNKLQRQEAYQARLAEEGSKVPKKLAPAKVITLTIPQEGSTNKAQKVVFNTSNKPMVCVLHEYAQSVLKAKPFYTFATKDDSNEPFEATTVINGKEYGKETGFNKKTAKNKAALATMEMLVPGFKDQVDDLSRESSLDYFDDVTVDDPRVYELCSLAGNYLPSQLLTECLKRNQGVADASVNFEAEPGRNNKLVEYKMECGKHTITGTAKNKKIGKNMAAQQLMKLLHPEVKSWGELIRMYGTSVAEKRARKRIMEQEIFELKQRKNGPGDFPKVCESGGDDLCSSDATVTSGGKSKENMNPNPELLSKLKEMMLQLGREDQEKKSGLVDGEKKPKLLRIDVH